MARPLKTKEELKKETEEAFVKEFGITKEAAEKSAATKKEDPVLFSEEDRDKENEYPTFGSDFLEELEKDEPKYLSYADIGFIKLRGLKMIMTKNLIKYWRF